MTRNSWGKLHGVSEPLSPLSFLVVAMAAVPTLVVLFHPSASEILIWVVAEFVGGALFTLWDQPAFLRWSPSSRLVFPRVTEQGLESASAAEKQELLQSLISFPRARIQYHWLITAAKLWPPWLAILLLWSYTHDWTVQLGRLLIWTVLNCFVFNSLAFFEQHECISSIIADLHRRYDFSEAFKRVSFTETERDFAFSEAFALLGTLANLFTAQWVVVSAQAGGSGTAARGMLVVGLVGLVALGRIWFVSRRFHLGGLWQIVESLEGQPAASHRRALPLHSSRLLARFELAVNTLADRLYAHERELSHWISTRTEEQRFFALAEVSALVVHDLSSPLQAIQVSVHQAMADRESMKSPECLDRIMLNSTRSLELVQSLRTYLRATAPPERGAHFDEVHRYVMRLLSTRYSSLPFQAVTCVVAPEVRALYLDISRADLIHVLMNLLGNSLENLVEHRVSAPRIEIALEAETPDRAAIILQDNGTGLSPERFELLTGFALLVPVDANVPQSLGLRLVRRLVERHRGSLTVLPTESGRAGTRFRLELGRVAAGTAEQTEGSSGISVEDKQDRKV